MRYSTTLAASLLALPLLLAVGCAATPNQHSMRAADTIQAVASEVTSANQQLNTTMNSLDALLGTTEGDLRPPFRAFSTNVDRLQGSAESVRTRARDMRTRADTYLKSWEEQSAQLTNENLRAATDARRAEVRSHIDAVRSLAEEAGNAYQPLEKDLLDIRRVLSADLTPAGLRSVADEAQSAKLAAGKLSQALDRLSAEFTALGLSLRPKT